MAQHCCWRQNGNRDWILKGIYVTAVVCLFEVGNLEVRVSDSQGNAELVNWKKGNTNVVDGREEAIAVISGGCNVNLSKDGRLTGKQQEEHYRETIYIHRLSAP